MISGNLGRSCASGQSRGTWESSRRPGKRNQPPARTAWNSVSSDRRESPCPARRRSWSRSSPLRRTWPPRLPSARSTGTANRRTSTSAGPSEEYSLRIRSLPVSFVESSPKAAFFPEIANLFSARFPALPSQTTALSRGRVSFRCGRQYNTCQHRYQVGESVFSDFIETLEDHSVHIVSDVMIGFRKLSHEV